MLAASQRNAVLKNLNRQCGRALPDVLSPGALQHTGEHIHLIKSGVYSRRCVVGGLHSTRKHIIVGATESDPQQEVSKSAPAGDVKETVADSVDVKVQYPEASTESISNTASVETVTTSSASDVSSVSSQADAETSKSTEASARSQPEAAVIAEVTPVTTQSAAQQSSNTTANTASTTTASEAAPDSTWKKLSAWFAAVGVFLASLIASIKQLPVMVQQQQLKRLRDASDDDPLDADKHAAYLQLLNKVSPKDVLTRVESKEVSES